MTELSTSHRDELSAVTLDTDSSAAELDEAHRQELHQLVEEHQKQLDEAHQTVKPLEEQLQNVCITRD